MKKVDYINIKVKLLYIRILLRIYKYFKLPKKIKDKLSKMVSERMVESLKETHKRCQFTLEEIELMKSYLK